MANWLKGISYEKAFWNNVYRWSHTFDGMMGWAHYGAAIELEGFDANEYLKGLDNPIVLDVGCGMSYATGNYVSTDGGLIPLDIRYVDPLANIFNDIKKRHNRKLPDIEFGMMEYLTAFYPGHYVSLVIIQNALDHSASPVKGIMEALDVLENGGVLYLNHHINEAEMEHYKGFHQYNICEEQGRLIVWNRQSKRDISEMLEPCATVQAFTKANHVIAVVRKKADIPEDFLSDKEDKRELCRMVMRLAEERQNPLLAIRNMAVYWWFNAIQCLAQAMPWHIKMKVKHLIHQA